MMNDDIPEANPEQQGPSVPMDGFPPLRLGEPFAIGESIEFIEPLKGVHTGCSAIVRCGAESCDQTFRIDLLSGGFKQCPKCHTKYSHCLLIAPADDDELVASAMAHVLRANGYNVPDDDDDEPDDGGP